MSKRILMFSEPLTKRLWLKNQSHHFEQITYVNGWMPLSKVNRYYPFFLHQQYQLHPDLSKQLIKYLDYVQLNQHYEDDKIKRLQTIKRDLVEQELLLEPLYNDYRCVQLENAFVPPMFSIDERRVIFEKESSSIPLYKAENQEEQIYFVFEKVVELLESGVDINHIKILNSTDDDDFQLKKLFFDAKIPFWIHKNRSITYYPAFQRLKECLLNEGVDAMKAMVVDLNQKQPDVALPVIQLLNRYPQSWIEEAMDVFLLEFEQLQIQPKRLSMAI